MATSNTLAIYKEKKSGEKPKRCSQKPSPFTAALVPLPSLQGIAPYITRTTINIDNSQLAQTGLFLTEVLSLDSVKQPGPWDIETDPSIIKTDLVFWLDRFIPVIKTECSLFDGYELCIDYSKRDEEDNIYLKLYYEHKIWPMYSAILPKLSKVDKGLEAIVKTTFRTLCWMKPSYTYDDVIEQIEDHSEDHLQFGEIDEGEKIEIDWRAEWIKGFRPEDRFFLRGIDERPVFPEFPKCPETSSWTHSWWQWAKKVKEASQGCQTPIQHINPSGMLGRDVEIIEPDYLDPFLWEEGDLVEEWHLEFLNCEAESGCEAISFYPISSKSDIKESLHTIKALFEWKSLFQEGCLLSYAE